MKTQQATAKPVNSGQSAVPVLSGTTTARAGPVSPQIEKDRQQKITNLKILSSAGAAAALLATAFKDGLKTGIGRISGFSESISNLISVFFSFSFIPVTMYNEYKYLKGEAKGGDESLFTRMFYTAASLGFLPNSFSEPFKAALKSPAHMGAFVLNLPNIVYGFLTYTGGRALGLWTAIKKNFAKKGEEFRLEQEFDGFYKLGNMGSSQISVIPGSEQCVTGLQVLFKLFKGDFGSAWEAFKDKPVSAFLGTFFNWYMWPFDWLSKVFDTMIRTAEKAEQFENAFPHGANNRLITALKDFRKKWHNKSLEDTTPGKILRYGRDFSKVLATFIPPIGMVSVVTPTFNKFLKGNFFNKEAQEIGGFVGFFDKIFNVKSFFGHLYYTGVYAVSVRAPQMVTTAAFYATEAMNHMRGLKYGDEGYVDPSTIRDKLFFKKGGFIEKISNWAEKKLNRIENDLHGESADVIDPAKKKSKLIRNFAEVMAQEYAYIPIKEEMYREEVENKEYSDPGLEGGFKHKGFKPSDKKWGEVLENRKNEIIEKAAKYLEEYAKTSHHFDDHKLSYFKNSQDWKDIMHGVEKFLESDIKACKNAGQEAKKIGKVDMPKTFLGLFTNPKALWEVLRLKTFHLSNTILPLWVQGFVNLVDFGRPGEEFWYRNFKMVQSAIDEGDIKQACDREYLPVAFYSLQSAGKGMAKAHQIYRLLFHGEPLPSSEHEYGLAA